jgi:predicted SAM-dependent methyltransferase
MEQRKLDIGCGRKKVPGAVGLDWIGNTDADIVCDLNHPPWPLEENSFDEVFAYNVLEHLPDIPGIMQEIHRVGRPKAKVYIKTPHFASLSSWEDPTHVHHFACESFDYFCESKRHITHYATCRYSVVRNQLHFGGHPLSWIGRLIHAISPREYEKHWAFVFRPSTLDLILQVEKD